MSAIDDIPNNIILFPPFNFRNIPVKVVSEMIRLLMDLSLNRLVGGLYRLIPL